MVKSLPPPEDVVSVGEFKTLVDSLIVSKNISMKELSKIAGVEPSTFSRYYNGDLPIPRLRYHRLQAYSAGTIQASQPPPGSLSTIEQSLINVLISLPGRLDQLTKQIADLQESVGTLKEEEKKRRANHKRTA